MTAVTAALTGSASKTYDGTTAATLTPANFQLTGFVNGDSANVTKTSGTYASKDVGSSILVSTSLTNSDFTPVGSTQLSNYSLPTSASGSIGSITPASLTIAATADTKTYDGTTSSSALPTPRGLVADDTITGLSQTYDNRNAGTGKTLSVSAGYTINDGNSGKNYTVTTASSSAGVITPASLTITPTANTKTYDGTVNSSALPTSKGLVSSDTITGLSQIYDNRNAGTGKTLGVSAGYTINDGNSGKNYTVTTVSSSSGTITPASLTITPTADTKTYDGTVNSSALPTSKGLVSGDTVTGLSQSYDNRNAGTGKTLRVSAGYTVNDGNSGNNYTVAIANSNAGVVTPAPLTITAAANTKTYDGTTSASALPVSKGLVIGDTITGLAQIYDNRNVGTGKTLRVSSGYTINDGNSGKNYSVSTVDSNAGAITPAPLTLTATANTKTYDGTASASALPTSKGLVTGDTITGLAQIYDNRNVGTGKTLSVSSGYTINDGNSGNNYTVATVNSNAGVITPALLTITPTADTKTYDGTVNSSALPTSKGLVSGDTITGLSQAYDDRNAGTGKTLRVSAGYTINDSNFGNNYTVTAANSSTGTITPAPLTVTAKDANKTFGQTLNLTGSEFSANGLQNGETIGSVVLFSSGFAATASVAGGPYPIIPSNANGGTFSSSNYSITYVNGVLTVTPAPLTAVTAALAGTTTKTYDGTTAATLTPANFLLSGFVNGDSASVTKTTGDYASKNVGSRLMVSTTLASSDFSPAGSTQLSNYSLPTSASGAIGSITPAPLTVTAKDASKIFGKTLSFSGSEFSASGLRNGETIGSVALSSTGAAASASVAGGPYPIIPSNASGGTFSPGNYNVTYVNGVLTVTPAPLTAVTAALTGTITKTYDGTTAATLTPANFLLSGFVNGDSASVTKTTGDYASKNVGSNLMVSTTLASSDFSPAGSTQLSNYSLPTSASGAIGSITPAPLTVAAKDTSKTFGKTLSFSGSEFSASGLRNGETIGSVALSSTGAAASASVAGGPYPIIPGNASGGTFSPGNYNVTYVNGVLTVTPAPLTAVTAALTGTITKTYDGTTAATLTPANFLLSGFVDGDSASVTKTTGDYASKNVGSNLMVSTTLASSDFSPAGSTQLSNYSLPTSASGAIGSITPAPLTVAAKDTSKTFGKTLSFSGSEFSASGLRNGETIGSVALSSTGAAASASVSGGPYPIIPSNASGGTFSPGNYNVTYVNGVLTVAPATLTAVTVALTGTTTKTYDGTTIATLTPSNFLLSGFVNGDSASVTKTTGNYANQNVGSNLMVSTTLASSDFSPAGSTQLSNYSLPTSASGAIGNITPAPLTVAAKDASKTFGKTLGFTGGEFTASGLQNGETIGNVSLSSTGAAASASVVGGPYPIVPSNAGGGTFSPSNYNVAYVHGVLTVIPAPLTAVTAALTGTTTKTYDGTTVATLTPANFLLSGFVDGDSASVTKATGDYESKNVGTNLVVSTTLANSDFAPAGSTQLSNYRLPNSASGAIGSITPAPLAITAKDASKTFGTTLSFTGNEFSSSGLRNAETIGNVVLSSAGAAAGASVAGSPYPIIPSNASGGTFSPSNYNVTYFNGTLTVNSAQTGTPTESPAPSTPIVFNEPGTVEAVMARAPTNLVVAFVEKMKVAVFETETKAGDKKKPKTDMVLEGEICRP